MMGFWWGFLVSLVHDSTGVPGARVWAAWLMAMAMLDDRIDSWSSGWWHCLGLGGQKKGEEVHEGTNPSPPLFRFGNSFLLLFCYSFNQLAVFDNSEAFRALVFLFSGRFVFFFFFPLFSYHKWSGHITYLFQFFSSFFFFLEMHGYSNIYHK